MSEIITLREYARRKNVSLTAVQNAEKVGRVQVIRDPDSGRIKGIDWSTQEHAWENNSKHPQKRPHHNAGGRPRLDGQPTATPSRQAPGSSAEPPPPPAGDKPGMTLAEIQRARELVKLQIDNEKLKQVRGESVPAADVEKNGRALAAMVISGMYSIPDRISDELAGMSDPHAIHKLLLEQIDNAVSELRKTYAPVTQH